MKKRILAAVLAAVRETKTRARIQKRNPGKRQRSRYLLRQV